ncbi:MAG: hypothetical protein US86_C0001G0275 [Candidatus Daviesbacteria bacterium GW2011_GWA2_38_24]|uniref:Uncharacterized protein n=1 Tax=Candidatus Daviesbacteria bacterium GW2011_GWA2_38_24 TaxID=1618422 RepID=A0A0G0JI21_9BACT|nr:MAG: hypothetical protein US86_C0001G0275 [Candidatus Daviesbacteria bacterium GW2011_GWA2_38_24]KKQ77924.1 MAG: hypothetical protein UT01_C0080G0008 [Candidatus Daviesbacteria bacterium GW2011_GWA1_38_7]OGE23624.1 MAG: hypothetical protein A2688_00485 [Candidatus Daviesbacteria bacterium RIFCSPHIGHO2_01_FULL_38_8]
METLNRETGTIVKILHSEMSEVTRAPSIDPAFGQSNLGRLGWEAANALTRDLLDLYEKGSSGKRRKKAIPRRVFIFDGEPLVGKSHFKRRMDRFFDIWITNLTQGSEEGMKLPRRIAFKSVTWEKDGEDCAVIKGRVQPGTRGVLPPEDLAVCNDELEKATLDAIDSSLLVSMEFPGITAIREPLPGKPGVYRTIGRNLGSDLLYKLAKREDEFGLLPEYQIYLATILGGENLKRLKAVERTDPGVARLLSLAQTPEEVASLEKQYGDILFKEGATQEAIVYIEEQVNNLVKKKWQDKIELVPPKPDYVDDEDFEPELELVQNYEYRTRSIAKFAEYIYWRDFRWHPGRKIGIPSSNILIGYNNPPLSTLASRSGMFLEDKIAS